MKDFLTNNDIVLSLVFAILDFLMFGYLLYRFIRRKKVYVLEMSLIGFGLFYDAFICALSGLLPLETVQTEGFKVISLFRFILHGALIPLLFPICGHNLPFKKKGLTIIYIVTGVVMIFGILQGCFTDLTTVTVGKMTRYAMNKETTARWVQVVNMIITIVPIIPLIATGVFILIKRKTPYLMLSGLLMFIFAAMGGGMKELNFLVSMVGEIFMLLFFIFYERWESKQPITD